MKDFREKMKLRLSKKSNRPQDGNEKTEFPGTLKSTSEFFNKSVGHLQKGKIKKAIKELYRALLQEPWNIDISYQMAALYQRMQDRENAIHVFRINLQLLEGKRIEISREEYERALILIYRAILGLDPGAVDLRLRVGKHYLAQKKHKAAFMEFFIALGHARSSQNVSLVSSVRALINRVQLSSFEKDLLIAEYYHKIRNRELYKKCLVELEKKYGSNITTLRGIYERHLNFYPFDEKGIRKYCMLLIQLKEYREANSLLRKALSVSPQNEYYLELLCITAIRLELFEESLELFDRIKAVYSKKNDKKKYDLAVKNVEQIRLRIQKKASRAAGLESASDAPDELFTIVQHAMKEVSVFSKLPDKPATRATIPEDLKAAVKTMATGAVRVEKSISAPPGSSKKGQPPPSQGKVVRKARPEAIFGETEDTTVKMDMPEEGAGSVRRRVDTGPAKVHSGPGAAPQDSGKKLQGGSPGEIPNIPFDKDEASSADFRNELKSESEIPPEMPALHSEAPEVSIEDANTSGFPPEMPELSFDAVEVPVGQTDASQGYEDSQKMVIIDSSGREKSDDCRWRVISEELLSFYEAQVRDPLIDQPKDQMHEQFISFLAKSREMVKDDFRACIDLGMACHTMGLFSAAVELYRIAIKLRPEKKEEIEALMNVNVVQGVRKIAA